MNSIIDLTNEDTVLDLTNDDGKDKVDVEDCRETKKGPSQSFFSIVLNKSHENFPSPSARKNPNSNNAQEVSEFEHVNGKNEKRHEMFLFCEKNKRYEITKNINCRVIEEVSSVPVFFRCDEQGFGTFIRNEKRLDDEKFWGLVSGQSLSIVRRRETSVTFNKVPTKVQCTVKACSGVKCCQYSLEKSQKMSHATPRPNNPNVGVDEKENAELELAKQVFFWSQQNFPLHCKHEKVVIENRRHRDKYSQMQRRIPNWTFRRGKVIYHSERNDESRYSSRLPDFVGCEKFGKSGLTSKGCCTLKSLPTELQNASEDIIAELLGRAKQGILPLPSSRSLNKCDPMPYTYTGQHCPNAIHGFEAVPLISIKCDVKYFFFTKKSENKIEWALVVGFGCHTHTDPVPRPSRKGVEIVVSNALSTNINARTKELTSCVRSAYGINATRSSIRKELFKQRRENGGYGNSIEEVVREFNIDDCPNPYVISVIDERDNDLVRKQTDQVGVSILMFNKDLLRKALENPNIGCDGTFNVVSSNPSDPLAYELNTIVCKDKTLGCVFPIFRQLASRKTKAARLHMFERLVSILKEYGLQDPLTCSTNFRLSFSTDFETTYAAAFATALAKVFHPNEDLDEHVRYYVHMCCFGCDVHAKRVILEKINISDEHNLYMWAVGTRRVRTIEERNECLSEMVRMGGKWAAFSQWMQDNYIANVLWFQDLHKCNLWGPFLLNVMHTSNANETENYRLKGCPSYLLTHGKGIQLCRLIRLLEQADQVDFDNLSGKNGVKFGTTPLFRRKRVRRENDNVIDLSGDNVQASQPKRARK